MTDSLIEDESVPLVSMHKELSNLMWYGKGPIYVLIGNEFLSRENIDNYLNEEMGNGMKIYGLKIIEEKYKEDNLILFEIWSYSEGFHYTDKLKRLDNFIYESIFNDDIKEASESS